MAKNWIEKLNVLVQASINDFVDEVGSHLPAPPTRMSGELKEEVEALRERVNHALAYEDKLEAQLQKLEHKILEIDLAADNALAKGEELKARRFLQEMRRLQQRAAMLEADLNQHRRATAELITNVNYFDSMVGDLGQQAPPPRREEAPPRTTPKQAAPSARSLSDAESRLSAGPAQTVEKTEPEKTYRIKVTAGDISTPAVPEKPKPPPETKKKKRKVYRISPASEPADEDEAPAAAVDKVDPDPKEETPAPQKPKSKRYAVPADIQPPEAEAPAEDKPVLPEVERLARALRKARRSVAEAEEKLGSVDEIRTQIEEDAGAELPEITGVPEPDPQDIDREIAARRARLEKKDDEDET